MSGAAPTVFVVDDEPSVRKGLGRLLRAAGYQVEVFASAREFLERKIGNEICCLVLDVQMPDLNGLELQSALAGAECRVPIIFITGHGDIPTSVRAMKAGAQDFIAKPFQSKTLLDAIDRALVIARERSQEWTASEAIQSRIATLTPREREVMLQMIRGSLNKQIAAALGAAEKTIKIHRSRVMRKMQVQSVADLVRLCEKVGIRVP